MSKIQDKIKGTMDEIQFIMESNTHLEPGSEIHKLMSSAGLYFAHMDDEDRDYYQAAQYALEEKMEWKV